ncbi:helix-turn-helix transcriptional regulator [Stappia sp. F7233]|uniref:Helix-turn-helix transcriptional regulator n=1 Tax=Stappia albiluteola TaxID=2758565 RepID=A0A839ACS1_9HYPH|nr:metalloregulator ArsR/SmtB family transcription factor [Stappia albiluteola]MBA5776905.1 helix-turn-helix transcriptional regulator [Stappia albiluteola]
MNISMHQSHRNIQKAEYRCSRKMTAKSREATDLIKALAHEGRLIILCRLSEGECSVAEFEEMLSIRQAAVSQQLARLRLEGYVKARREGKQIYYSLADDRVRELVKILYKIFSVR